MNMNIKENELVGCVLQQIDSCRTPFLLPLPLCLYTYVHRNHVYLKERKLCLVLVVVVCDDVHAGAQASTKA